MRKGSITKPIRERFWDKVDLWHGITDEDCWNWKSPARYPGGYGQFGLSRCKPIRAHRFSYILYKGEIPDGMIVRHKCDNPACVNPSHLELGTLRDNTADMIARKRCVFANRTHCKHGHEYAVVGFYKRKGYGDKHRICKACRKLFRKRGDRKNHFANHITR